MKKVNNFIGKLLQNKIKMKRNNNQKKNLKSKNQERKIRKRKD